MIRELQRLMSDRRLLLALLVLMLGNMGLFAFLAVRGSPVNLIEQTSMRMELLEQVNTGTLSEADISTQLEEQEVLLLLFSNAQEAQNGDSAFQDYLVQEEQSLREQWPELCANFDAGSYSEEEVRTSYAALSDVMTDLQSNQALQDHLTNIQQQSDRMNSSSILQSGTGRQNENVQRTLNAFQSLENVMLTVENSAPLTSYCMYQKEYIFAVAAAFLLVRKATEEKRWGLQYLTRSTARGRGILTVWRCIGLILGSVLVSAGLMLGTLLADIWLYGPLALEQIIQSIRLFHDFPCPMTTRQFLLLAYGVLLFTQIMLTFLFWLLFCLTERESSALLLGLGILGLSALCYNLIPVQSVIGWMKYLNLYTGIIWTKYAFSYYNLSIGSVLMNRSEFAIWVQIILCGLIGMVAAKYSIHPLQNKNRLVIWLENHTERIIEKCHTLLGEFSWKQLWGYRLLTVKKGGLILIFAVSLLILIFPAEKRVLVGLERLSADYYQHWRGPITQDTLNEIDQAQMVLEQEAGLVQASMDELTEQAGFSVAEYEQLYYQHQAIEFKQCALEPVIASVQYVSTQKQTGYDAWLLNPYGYTALFEEIGFANRAASIFCLCLLIWLTDACFGELQNEKLRCLQRSTQVGYQKMLSHIMTMCFIITLMLGLAVFGAQTYSVWYALGLDGLSAPAHSLPLFAKTPFNPPLWIMLMLWGLYHSIPLLLAESLLCTVAVMPCGKWIDYLADAILLLPSILTLSGLNVVEKISLWEIQFSCTKMLQNWRCLALLPIVLVLLVLLYRCSLHFWKRGK